MIVDGILALIFTAGTIGAAYAGSGALIEALADHAGDSLSQVVANSINAGEIML
jgi:hypothetical protein